VIYASTKLLSVIGNSSGKFNFCAMSLASWMINPMLLFDIPVARMSMIEAVV
jgi:hypothetical protein